MALKLRGVTMTAAKHTSYLGVDLGAGVRHALEQRVKRSTEHLIRHRKVVKYAKTLRRTKITSRLERQGGQAAGSCVRGLRRGGPGAGTISTTSRCSLRSTGPRSLPRDVA
eukprot:7045559-Pyramimonas_sp.AAC.1